jgi:hypothetical protein
MSEIHEVVAAFADGERVNGDDLDRALAAPEGREYLISLLALREVTVGQAAVGSNLVTPSKRRSHYLRLAVAAAVVCVSTMGGYAVGSRSARQDPSGVTVAGSSRAANLEPARETAPQPTRVIHLEPGIDWHERSGGN